MCVCVSVSCTSEAVLDFLLGESMRCAKQCKANCNCFSQKYSEYKQCPGSDLGAVFKYLNRQQHCTQDEINVEERSMCFIEVTRLQRRHPSPEVYKYSVMVTQVIVWEQESIDFIARLFSRRNMLIRLAQADWRQILILG